MKLLIAGIGVAVIALWTVCEIGKAMLTFEDPYTTDWYQEEEHGRND